ncbi:hypothetical protein CORC01_05224 [Colletotrichum orchidophilum]|uniref:Uncharacterized protein n=1 Tax=Colletotrichum orchidophilum TaxID=1209926 RepID=A0A1G4BDE2_9PEZI|nr:uncharacterized protein CORC01_05224 [Colletotrichum orchidophilum]OHE99424.1 hypothetical protein CORC01_05224 [Colletotrichum orchidophilum]
MSDQADAPVFGAFSSLLGYVGGQAATSAIFERFLWPQRHFSSFSVYDMPRLACLYSMAGPIGSVALDVIDTSYKNGLFSGAVQGHMLGTHFYRDLEWTYILHTRGGEPERESQIRNCLWVQALLNMPLPAIKEPIVRNRNDAEHGKVALVEMIKPVRARVAVSHLVLSKATEEDLSNSRVPFISEEIKHVDLLCLVEIILTECVGIGIMICVAAITGSLWSIIFIIPLVLRLIGTLFALEREGLNTFPDTVNDEQTRDWEINCPAIEGKFMLITGPPTIVNQFFRHYGHPVRNRFREVIQLAVVIAFGTYFPVGLLCQVTWMPVFVQYIWTVWQIWQVLVMHFDRYTQRGMSRTTTDAAIAAKLYKNFQPGEADRVFRSTILFGQRRNGPAVVKASLSLTVADSYADGKKVLKSAVRK